MRIAIVNDMTLALESLRRIVVSTGAHEIAWVARDGAEAVKRCEESKPDLILMDLIMPVVNGVEATRRIMAETPCPILIVTSSVGGNAALVFDAMGAGALDAVRTPILAQDGDQGSSGLLAKITMIQKLMGFSPARTDDARAVAIAKRNQKDKKLVAIGASTGGPKALVSVLSALPADFPAAIVVVQHVDAQFAEELAEWLNKQCSLQVRSACLGDRPTAGSVLVARTNDHLILNAAGCLDYTVHPRHHAYRPSVDVFYDSVVEHWGGDVVGVLLTGMGRDGGLGMRHLRERGHYTIAEHQSTCAVYGMPKAAVDLNAVVDVLPIDEIGMALRKRFAGASNMSVTGSVR